MEFRDFMDRIVCKLIDIEIDIEEKCGLLDWDYGRSSLCVFVMMYLRVLELVRFSYKY